MSRTEYLKSEYTFLRIDPGPVSGYMIVLFDIENTIELEIQMHASPGYDFVQMDDRYIVVIPPS